uniref:Uncharacterized protein n=1 Tax=Fagus sylvatica TaxID=28930 RepID=A0A2N9EV19_FAGSY
MALFASISTPPLSISVSIRPLNNRGRFSYPFASLSSSSSPSSSSSSSPSSSSSSESKASPSSETILSSTTTTTSSSKPFAVDPSRSTPNSNLNYALANPNGSSPVVRFVRNAESTIERVLKMYGDKGARSGLLRVVFILERHIKFTGQAASKGFIQDRWFYD